jgi:DNA replication protein DnaC
MQHHQQMHVQIGHDPCDQRQYPHASDGCPAADQRQLSRVIGRYGRLDLLLLDELGYVQLDPRGAELLFQIITRTGRTSLRRDRDEPAVQRMGNGVPDPRLVAAIVDRVTFNAHILETGTQSYRLAASKTAARRKSSR